MPDDSRPNPGAPGPPAEGALPEADRPHGNGLRLTLLIAASLTIMSGATISSGLPGMRDHFAGQPGVETLTRLVLTIPALFIALGAPVAGWVADRIGRLRVMVAGAVLYAASGMSGLLVGDIWALLAGRALLGLSVACVMTATTALAGDYFRGAERGRFLGLQAAFMGLGGLVFVTGGGFLADVHWRAPFAIYAAALVVPVLVALFLHEPARAPAREGPSERVPPAVWAVLGAAMFTMIAFYLVPVQLPFLLEQDLGVAERSRAGMAIGVATLASSGASLAITRLGGGLPVARVIAMGFASMAAAYVVVWTAGSYAAVLAGMVPLGMGMGMMMPSFSVAVLGMAPEALRGRLSGALGSAVFLGQFVSPLVSQPLAHGGALQPVFGWFAGALALGAVGALALSLSTARPSRPA